MKKTIISLLLATLPIFISGCKTASNTESTEVVKNTIELGSAEIKKSGHAQPLFQNNQLVGYEFKKGFAVPAELGNFFGFSYQVNQLINSTTDNPNSTGYVATKVPVTVTVVHPEIMINGKPETTSSWEDTLYFGRDNFAMWKFENANELVNGKWTISVAYQQKEIATKNFFVRVPPKMPKKVTQVCQVEIDKFPRALQQANTACCTNNDAQACYNFAWRGLERIRDKKGAALYYAKSCELGDISGCRQAAKMATTPEKRDAFYHKGCDLKDMDSCIEVNRLN
ncbi:DUF3859 domain-containing protein [Pseudoalteromonas peptidolytica]|uniref:DUF3859 domain-containing protein n=1 Tax=Pseudoalteromonas peptidolytica F12-50-A1 TaxID=1315280 RepID=A0A8I0T5W1_9GAMM|nr:DUF3859 domain-containing protein [Pseudoalteromonas peptidolytica]MBE0347688.1 hypothetical protein [Pseudoalteromonas peptidolytica F12-50-A1]NLR16136.1 DUF3859 domain-containing protein [Pseudoalteromonas peptidolytica]GEK11687.1 hypothetical protein PPE03_39360 [Pseudoalteromonas peptidolytica]